MKKGANNMGTAQGIIAEMRKEGQFIEIYEGYTRYIMCEDGRVLRQGMVRNIRSKYVWIDDENKTYYTGLANALEGIYGRELR